MPVKPIKNLFKFPRNLTNDASVNLLYRGLREASATIDLNTQLHNASANSHRWLEETDFVSKPPSTSTISLRGDRETDFAPGTPIRFDLGGTATSPGTYFAISTAASYAAGFTTCSIAGPPLETDQGDLTALYRGYAEQVMNLQLQVLGTYADGLDADLLVNDMLNNQLWQYRDAYCVMLTATHNTADATVQPVINLQIANASVSAAGVLLTTAASWQRNPAVDISAANYAAEFGDEIEIACTTVGGTGDAANLVVIATFVLD